MAALPGPESLLGVKGPPGILVCPATPAHSRVEAVLEVPVCLVTTVLQKIQGVMEGQAFPPMLVLLALRVVLLVELPNPVPLSR